MNENIETNIVNEEVAYEDVTNPGMEYPQEIEQEESKHISAAEAAIGTVLVAGTIAAGVWAFNKWVKPIFTNKKEDEKVIDAEVSNEEIVEE